MISLEGLRTACLSGSGPRVIDAAEAYEGAWREEHARFAKLLAAHRSPPSSSHYARRKQRVATRALDDDVRQQLRSALSSRDARRRGRTLLHLAARSGSVAAVDAVFHLARARAPRSDGAPGAPLAALLTAADDRGATALHVAAAGGSAKVAGRLARAGALAWALDDEGRTPLDVATSYAVRAAIVPPCDAVRLACRGDSTALRAMLDGGAGGEARLGVMLRAAAAHTTDESAGPFVVRLLLDAGARAAAADGAGATALHACARACSGRRSRTTARALLDAGGAPAARTHRGRTPLHALAAAHPTNGGASEGAERCRFARLLLRRGAEVDDADEEGRTALHLAARSGQHIVAHALLEAGASPLLRSAAGDIPLHLAAAGLTKTYGCAAAVRLLLRVDADTISGSGARVDALSRPGGDARVSARHRIQRDVAGRMAVDRFAVVGGGGGRRVPPSRQQQAKTAGARSNTSSSSLRRQRGASQRGDAALGAQRGAANKRGRFAHDVAAHEIAAHDPLTSAAVLRPMLSLWAAAASANVGAVRELLRSARHFAARVATCARDRAAPPARRRRDDRERGDREAASKTTTTSSSTRSPVDAATLSQALRLRSYDDIGATDDLIVEATIADAIRAASSPLATATTTRRGSGASSKDQGRDSSSNEGRTMHGAPESSADSASDSDGGEDARDRGRRSARTSSPASKDAAGSKSRRSDRAGAAPSRTMLLHSANRAACPVTAWSRTQRRMWTPLHCAAQGLISALAVHRSATPETTAMQGGAAAALLLTDAEQHSHHHAPLQTPLITAGGERLSSREQILARYREVIGLLLATLHVDALLNVGTDGVLAGGGAVVAVDDASAAAPPPSALTKHLATREQTRGRERGAGASAHEETIDARDVDGCTALIFAVEAGAPLVVQQLLQAGAQSDLADRCGNSPLHYAWAFCDDETRDLMVHVLGNAGEAEVEGGRRRGGHGDDRREGRRVAARTPFNDLGQTPDEVAGYREQLTAPLRALRRRSPSSHR